MSTDNSASPETPSNEEGWGTDFDAFEQGASKIVALWEVAPSGELAKPTAPSADAAADESSKEAWAAADPAVSTLPDPVPPDAPKAAAAEAPAAAAAPAKKALPAPGRSAKKTLIAGSLEAPRAAVPAALSAPASGAAPVGAPVAGPVGAPVDASADAPVAAPASAAAAPVAVAVASSALPSVVVEPQQVMEAPRASVAPDTIIDAKPLDRPSRPLPSLVSPVASVAPVEEPIPLPPRGSNTPLVIGAVAFVLLGAMVGGFLLFRASPTPPPATAAAAVVAPTAPASVPAVPAPTHASPPAAGTTPPAPAVAPAIAEAVAAPVEGAAAVVEGAGAEMAVAPVAEAVAEAAAVPPPTPPTPPPPVTHALSVNVEPTTATVTVDGAPVTLPYEARFDEGTRHTVVASAEGYGEATRVVELDGDRRVSLRLERERERRGGSRIGSRIVRRGGSGSSSGSSGSSSSRGSGSSGRRGSGTFVSESPY